MKYFIDRAQAGQLLAKKLQSYKEDTNAVALALPRGGVPVAFEIAQSLLIPLGIFFVRKLGVPSFKELAMGAIGSGGSVFINQEIVDSLRLTKADIDKAITREQKEIVQRQARYHIPGKPNLPTRDKTILLIDDGIATGATMSVAVLALRKSSPKKIIVVAPVGAQSSIDALSMIADEVVCLYTPADFGAVGFYYDIFSQTTDEEVCDLLQKSSFPVEKKGECQNDQPSL